MVIRKIVYICLLLGRSESHNQKLWSILLKDFQGKSEITCGVWPLRTKATRLQSLKLNFHNHGGNYNDKESPRFSGLRRVSFWIPFILMFLPLRWKPKDLRYGTFFAVFAGLSLKQNWWKYLLRGPQEWSEILWASKDAWYQSISSLSVDGTLVRLDLWLLLCGMGQ